MGIARLIVKHIMRLRNTLTRRYRMICWKWQYGAQFQAKKFHFRDNFRIYIEEQGILQIGKNVFFNNGCSLTVREKVSIGDDCIFGENVKIYDHNHCYKDNDKLIRLQGFSSGEVTIGEDCWIGSNVVILKGVTIGAHSVVGGGVIVHKDLPEHSVTICKQECYTTYIHGRE